MVMIRIPKKRDNDYCNDDDDDDDDDDDNDEIR